MSKRLFTVSLGTNILRLDHQRVEFIASQMMFDVRRKIVAMPAWETLIEGCRQLPALTPPEHTAEPRPDRMATAGDHARGGSRPRRSQPQLCQLERPVRWLRGLLLPDASYSAATLQSAAHLDYLRLCLCFPGVEVGLNSSGWQIIVYTRCRHLEHNRCGI